VHPILSDKSARERFMLKDLEFQNLYKQYFSQVCRHLNYLLGGDCQAAEEIAQETFVKLYTSPPLTRDNLSAWLIRVATNLAYNHLKSSRQRAARENRAVLAGSGIQPHGLPEETYIRNQQVLAVKEVLDLLSDRDRICLLLKFSGFSYAEIAEIAGVQPNSVGTVLARAQARFKKEFLLRNRGDI